MVHLLVHSKQEYEEMTASLRAVSLARPVASSSSSSLSSSLHTLSLLLSLAYNSSLTERWIHPQLEVADAATVTRQKEKRQREQERVRELQQQGMSGQIPDTTTATNTYSTIEMYECYYDYDGTMQWIEDFVTKHKNSKYIDVQWIDIGDSHLKAEAGFKAKVEQAKAETAGVPTSLADKLLLLSQAGGSGSQKGQEEEEKEDDGDNDSDGDDAGHDIRVLTITGKKK